MTTAYNSSMNKTNIFEDVYRFAVYTLAVMVTVPFSIAGVVALIAFQLVVQSVKFVFGALVLLVIGPVLMANLAVLKLRQYLDKRW